MNYWVFVVCVVLMAGCLVEAKFGHEKKAVDETVETFDGKFPEVCGITTEGARECLSVSDENLGLLLLRDKTSVVVEQGVRVEDRMEKVKKEASVVGKTWRAKAKMRGGDDVDVAVWYYLMDAGYVKVGDDPLHANNELWRKIRKDPSIEFIRSEEEMGFSCPVSRRFERMTKLSTKFVSGSAYVFDDVAILVSYERVFAVRISDVRRTYYDVCVADSSEKIFEIESVSKVEQCARESKSQRFLTKCEDRCGSEVKKFHSSTHACCDCDVTVKAKERWISARGWFEYSLGLDLESIQDEMLSVRISSVLLNFESLIILADILSVFSLMNTSPLLYGVAMALSLFGYVKRPSMDVALGIMVRALLTFPNMDLVKFSFDFKVFMAVYGFGTVLTFWMRVAPSPYVLMMIAAWYVLLILMIATVSRYRLMTQKYSHVYVGLFLMNGVSALVASSLDGLMEEGVKGGIMCVMYLVVSPLQNVGFTSVNVLSTTQKVMDVMPVWLQRDVGNEAWLWVVIGTLMWNIVYVVSVRVAMSRVTHVHLNSGEPSSLKWLMQSVLDWPKVSSVREIVASVVMMVKGNGGVEVLLICALVYYVLSLTDATTYLTEDEVSEREQEMKRRRKGREETALERVERTGFRMAEVGDDEDGGSREGVDYSKVIYDNDMALLLSKLTEKVSSKLPDYLVEAARCTKSVGVYAANGITLGKGVLLDKGARTKAKLVSIHHVVSDVWDKARLGDFVEMMVSGVKVSVQKIVNPTLVKDDQDRAVYFEIKGTVPREVARVSNVKEGEEVSIISDGVEKKGVANRVSGHIWKISGVDVKRSESGGGVWRQALSDDGKPICLGIIASRMKDGTAVLFHDVASFARIGEWSPVEKTGEEQEFGELVGETPDELARITASRINENMSRSLKNVSATSSHMIRFLVHDLARKVANLKGQGVSEDEFFKDDEEQVAFRGRVVKWSRDLESGRLQSSDQLVDNDLVQDFDRTRKDVAEGSSGGVKGRFGKGRGGFRGR